MRYGYGAFVGAAIGVTANILLVWRALNDASNPYANESALGYAWVPLAALVGAASGVTVTMVITNLRKSHQSS